MDSDMKLKVLAYVNIFLHTMRTVSIIFFLFAITISGTSQKMYTWGKLKRYEALPNEFYGVDIFNTNGEKVAFSKPRSDNGFNYFDGIGEKLFYTSPNEENGVDIFDAGGDYLFYTAPNDLQGETAFDKEGEKQYFTKLNIDMGIYIYNNESKGVYLTIPTPEGQEGDYDLFYLLITGNLE